MPMVCDDEGMPDDQNTHFFRGKFAEGFLCAVVEARK